MSNGHLNWAWRQVAERDLEKADALVLLCIADMVNKAGEAWPTVDYIARRTNLDPATVWRSVTGNLIPKGLLERNRRGKSWGYKLTETPCAMQDVTSCTTQHDAGNEHLAPRKMKANGHLAPRKKHLAPRKEHLAPRKIEPSSNPQEPSVPSGTADAAVATSAQSPRDLLFSEGVAIVQNLIGVMDSGARNFLGQLLKTAKDDAALVLTKLREAKRDRPLDAAGWLIKACVPFRHTGIALLAAEGSSVRSAEVAEMEAAWERISAARGIGHA